MCPAALKRPLPPKRPLVTTSWDGGHPLDLRLAEQLDRHGLAATFYVPRSSQRKTMTDEEIRSLAERFEVGAHTLDHVALPTLPDVQAERQILDSGQWVSDVTSQPCRVFCPPGGRLQREHINAIARHGYIGYRSTDLLQFDRPKVRTRGDFVRGDVGWPLATLNTSVQAHPHERSAYVRHAIQRLGAKTLQRAWAVPRGGDWVSLAETMLAEAERTCGVFHLWGDTADIESNDQWANVDRALSMLGDAVASGRLDTATNGDVCSGG